MEITENHLDRLKDVIALERLKDIIANCGDKELVAYLRFDDKEEALTKLREIDKALRAWEFVKISRVSWRGKFWEEGDWYEVVVAWD